MRLVKFKSMDTSDIYINSEYIVSVTRYHEDSTLIYTSTNNTFSVQGSLEVIAAKLEGTFSPITKRRNK